MYCSTDAYSILAITVSWWVSLTRHPVRHRAPVAIERVVQLLPARGRLRLILLQPVQEVRPRAVRVVEAVLLTQRPGSEHPSILLGELRVSGERGDGATDEERGLGCD